MPRSRRSLFMLVLLVFSFVASVSLGEAQTSTQTPTPAQPRTQIQNGQRLTLMDAENIAIQNHPQIQAAAQFASAAAAQVKEVQSVYFPQANGSATGTKAETNSRIAAGFLNSPSVYDKFADGISVTQLVTDFGRTHELSKSSHFHAQAQQENVVTTRADVLLRVSESYFGALKAQSVLKVAEETVKARQLVVDQVSALAKSNLKSGLDVSFANVDLARAQLLLVQAQNDLQSSYAQLSDALGYQDQRTFQLVDEPLPGAPPADVSPLVTEAMQNRPELISEGLDVKSAQSYATAERDLWFPTISAAGVTGLVPFRQDPLPSRYAAAGFNLNIPIFNGRLFNALHTEATARARAQEQILRDLQNRIAQDVRTSWLNAVSAFQRLSLTQQLLDESMQAYDLAKARYGLGLSSIIELSQAQLALTEAQIEQVSAQYDYESQTANLDYQLGRVK
ncbi:MAG TPA: TolC family protein [Candidatus Acidoferrales bacterium]|nr:TolC family protein [Candidatus Acidoferrales bacterium]